MIVVLADDLSGAAELAGAALEHGLSAEVQTEFQRDTDAAVVCLDTDSRLLPPEAAAERVRGCASSVLAASPAWIYKKTDSVLRGPVAAELQALLDHTPFKRAILIPANPEKKRIIRNGCYFIHEIPLHETVFARDPEYPRRTSRVRELLDEASRGALENQTLVIPDAATREDLRQWAARIESSTLPAGGVEFFEAILRHKGHARVSPPPAAAATDQARRLYVCGSVAAWMHGRKDQTDARGIPLAVMPSALFTENPPEAEATRWADQARQWVERRGCVMVALGDARFDLPFPPAVLTTRLAIMLERLLASTTVERIYLEGGATAAAFLHRMHWTRLIARSTVGERLAALQVTDRPEISLFIKPGSYDWPDEAWAA